MTQAPLDRTDIVDTRFRDRDTAPLANPSPPHTETPTMPTPHDAAQWLANNADRVTITGHRGMKAVWFEKTFASHGAMEKWLAKHDDVVVDRYSFAPSLVTPPTETTDAR